MPKAFYANVTFWCRPHSIETLPFVCALVDFCTPLLIRCSLVGSASTYSVCQEMPQRDVLEEFLGVDFVTIVLLLGIRSKVALRAQ